MTTRPCRQRLLTVPNVLSLLRLAMIPVFVTLYINGQMIATAVVLLLSGLTDVLDGWYARRFDAITDLGKVLDPVADKLTQAAMLLMLAVTHALLRIPLALLLVKESVVAVTGMLVVLRTGEVPAALWHGKATTALLDLTMFVLVLWKDIPAAVSNTLIIACTVMMFLSMTLYAYENIRRMHGGGRGGT